MSKPNYIEIYGHRPDLSSRVEAGKKFFDKEFNLKCLALLPFSKRRLRIQVNKYNFLYVKEMIAYCSKFLPGSNRVAEINTGLNFVDFIRDDLYKDFQAYADRLNSGLHPYHLCIHVDDGDLKDLFNAMEQKIERKRWKDFVGGLVYVKDHATHLNDELRVLGILLDRSFIGPVDLVLDLIHVCNTDCIHCWVHSPAASKRLGPGFRKQVMAFETVTSIVDDACRLGVNGITLLGDGEPLLHPRFIDILRYIRQKHLFMEILTFTNGYCLTESVSRQLIREGLNQLTCSLPAATPGTYARICSKTGEKGFDRIVENLKTLNRLKRRKRPHKLLKRTLPEVTLAFVLHRLNCHEICDMARLAGETGADTLRYQLIHLDEDNRQLQLTADQLGFLKEQVPRARRIAEAYGLNFQSSLDFQLDHVTASRGDWSEDVYLEKGCYIGWTFSILKADGDLGLCCALKKIGSITDGGYQAKWTSDQYNTYRVAAKNMKANVNLLFEKSAYQKEENGFRLFSEGCQHCDNHDQNNYMLQLLEKSGLVTYLEGRF